MSIHVPSSKQSPVGPERDVWQFDAMTKGDARLDFSSFESATPALSGPQSDDEGFVVAFTFTPSVFSEPR